MRLYWSVLAFLSMCVPAFADGGAQGGFSAGISHPVLGLDHLLAMVSVGVISSQMADLGNKKAIWTVPTLFVIVMAIGGLMGMANFGIIAVEIGIALSVIILGLAIAGGAKVNEWIIYAFVSLFAIFHGYAHGHEIPELASSWQYIAGFMLGTAGLHILGVLIGYFANRIADGIATLRYTGAAVSGIGFHILWGLAGY